MSLVNDMLRDLDGRNTVAEHNTTPLPSGLRNRHTPPWRVPLVGFMVVLPLGLFALFIYKHTLSVEYPQPGAKLPEATVQKLAAAMKPDLQTAEGISHPPAQVTQIPDSEPSALEQTERVFSDDRAPVGQNAQQAVGVAADTDTSDPVQSISGSVVEAKAKSADKGQSQATLASNMDVDTAKSIAKATAPAEPTGAINDAMASQAELGPGESQLEVTPTLASLDQRAVQSARAALQVGDRSLARSQLLEFLTEQAARDQWPQQSRRMLADIYIEAGELARVDSLQATALPATQAAYLRAQLAQARGEHAKALQALEVNYVSALEHDETYRALLAGLYQRMSRSVEAEAHYRRLLETFGNKARYWLGLALALDRQSEFGSAATAYRQALQTRDITAPLQQFIDTRLQQLNGMH